MSTELMNFGGLDEATALALVTGGDCAKLSPKQRVGYYKMRCEAAGLDPRTSPFQFVQLNGKLVLYATKAVTDQLAAKNHVACEIISQTTDDGIRVVTVRAKTADGRQTDEIGCVSVAGMKGDVMANAMMKAVTKAKRRAVLSLCGLGMLDETELETIKGAVVVGHAEDESQLPAVAVEDVSQEIESPAAPAEIDVWLKKAREAIPALDSMSVVAKFNLEVRAKWAAMNPGQQAYYDARIKELAAARDAQVTKIKAANSSIVNMATMDRLIAEYTREVVEGVWKQMLLPPVSECTLEQMNALEQRLKGEPW